MVYATSSGRLAAWDSNGANLWEVVARDLRGPPSAAADGRVFAAVRAAGGTLDPAATVNLVLPDNGMSFRAGQPMPL